MINLYTNKHSILANFSLFVKYITYVEDSKLNAPPYGKIWL